VQPLLAAAKVALNFIVVYVVFASEKGPTVLTHTAIALFLFDSLNMLRCVPATLPSVLSRHHCDCRHQQG